VGLGGLNSFATGVSADGSTVVGNNLNGAFIWTAASGMVGLGTLGDPLHSSSYASAISADGTTVVGQSYSSTSDQAFIWTAATGMVGLGTLPGALYQYSYASAVSADGSTVVGATVDNDGFPEAFIWTAATGMVGLGTLGFPGGSWWSHATGVSADGSTVVGTSTGNGGTDFPEAFIWTAATGMVGLGALPGAGFPESRAYGVSADGLTVVGESDYEAFILTLSSGDPAEILIAGLIPQVASVNLQNGIENSLDAKLDAAFGALDGASAQDDLAAINALGAFINAVKAQSGKAIPAADADALIAAAQKIVGLLQ